MQLRTRDDAGSVRQIGDSSLLSDARTKAPEMDIMIVQERIPIPFASFGWVSCNIEGMEGNMLRVEVVFTCFCTF